VKIAILGASSQIAKDLITSFALHTDYACTLFVRDRLSMQEWVSAMPCANNYALLNYPEFNHRDHYDVILNFVGIGDPARAQQMGSVIFDVTFQYDRMVLDYLQYNPSTRYIFLSSGAVYGGDFAQPVSADSVAILPLNNLTAANWYAIAKLYAEARHRALFERCITDVRVFNYFSHTQDLSARFLITDLLRALTQGQTFITTAQNIVRDFVTPADFFNLIECIMRAPAANQVVDVYTRAPVDKFTLLQTLQDQYGLDYEVSSSGNSVNATGAKMNYYSLNKAAQQLGYRAQKTSLEGVLDEIAQLGFGGC